MSSNVEDSDGSVRVTRNSMRRMASNESLNSVDARADTPTLQLRTKKLESISENASATPQNKTRAMLDSPRRTRKGSLEPASVAATASPLRRTTRAMSQDIIIDITGSPMPTRVTRRSAVGDSDTDDMSTTTVTPARVKSARKKRQSVKISPTIDNINEESEDDDVNDMELKEDEPSNDLNLSNDLELRSRSITKSPQVHISPRKSFNGSPQTEAEKKTNNGDETSQEINFMEFSQVEEEDKPRKFFKSHDVKDAVAECGVELGDSMNECGSEQTEIEPFSNVHSTAQVKKTTFDGVVERLVKSHSKSKPASPSTHFSPTKSMSFVENQQVDEDAQDSGSNTPVQGRRSIHDGKTPRTPIESKLFDVDKMLVDFVSDENEVKTPKSGKKVSKKKTPKKTPLQSSKNVNGDETIRRDEPMDITLQGDESNMEISVLDSSLNKTKLSLPMNDSSTEDVPESAKKNKSFSSYLAEVTNSSTRIKRKSQGVATASDQEPGDSPEKEKLSRSWSQTVAKQVDAPIDRFSKSPRTKIVETATMRVKGYSSDESEDDEYVEKNSFVDDEADVGSNDSITESELNYLKENEIPDEGESVGSQDSIELGSDNDEEDGEVAEDEEKDGDDSFIDTDEEISNSYSMDSNEEKIEEFSKTSPSKQKRKSRLIFQSDSEEEPDDKQPSPRLKSQVLQSLVQSLNEEVLAEKPKTPRKSLVDGPKETESVATPKAKTPRKSMIPSTDQEEPIEPKSSRKSLDRDTASVSKKKLRKSLEAKAIAENLEKPKLKRKHEADDANVSVVVKTKRLKLNQDTAAYESEAMATDNVSGIAGLFEDESTDSEADVQEKLPKKATKSSAVTTDVESVISKCNELMSVYNESKKKGIALKREKKALKQLKKQEEAVKALATAVGDNLDSSGSNKENSIKKKKKKSKEKKQKLVADVPDESKEDISTSVARLQEKMERKRQRKLEKKLAKQQEQVAGGVTENKAELEQVVNEAIQEKRVKKAKKSKVAEQPAIVQDATSPVPKIKKIRKTPKVDDKPEFEEDTTLPVPKAKKTPKVDEPIVAEEVPKKRKKSIEDMEVVEEVVKEKKQKKLKQVAQVESVADVTEKKKSKKRKIDQVLIEDETPKPKKLNVLKQIEDPWQFQAPARAVGATKEPDFTVPLGSTKLKKVIPANVEIAKKKSKKSKKQRRVIPEPPTSLPRPVWTTSGIFIEQPTTPAYKFKSTKYVPIGASASASTSFGVVAFEAAKKKPKERGAENQPEDFRSRYLSQNTKGRDGSQKNIRGLMSTKSF